FDFVVIAFPLVLVQPQESEPNSCFLVRQRKVDKLDIDTCGGRACIGRVKPFIGGPVQQERRIRLYPQAGTDLDRRHFAIEFPYLHWIALTGAAHVAIIYRFNQVTTLAVRGGAAQFHVFCVSPQEWNRRAGLAAKEEMLRRQVRRIPDLFRDQTNATLKTLERAEVQLSITVSCKLVIAL